MTNDVQAEGELRVIYDDIIYWRQRHGGISEFWRKLTQRMRLHPAVHCEWENLIAFSLLRPNRSPNVIFHSSYYRHSRGRNTATVTTAHDFIHERGIALGHSSLRSSLFSRLKRIALETSAVIVCDSNATASDLSELYPVIAQRVPIHVVHLAPTVDGAALDDPTAVEMQFGRAFLSEPFLLFVGARDGYKNFSLFLQALRHLQPAQFGVRVLVVGKPFTARELQQINTLKDIAAVIDIGQVDNQSLAKLYQTAIALVYPSAYEGFGLPVLDSMSLGCPVVAARIPSVVEVAGDAAAYFDSNSVESLAAAIVQVLDSSKRHALRDRGLARSRRFAWESTVEGYLAAYLLAEQRRLH